jgi:hypothetical protein
MRLSIRRLAAFALCTVPAVAWAEPPWPAWFVVTAVAFAFAVPVAAGAIIGVIAASRQVRASRGAAISGVVIFLAFYLIIVLNAAGDGMPAIVAALFPLATLGGPLALGIFLGHRWLRRSQKIEGSAFATLSARRKRGEIAVAVALAVLVTGLDFWLGTVANPGPPLACAEIPVKTWRIEEGAGDDAVLAVTVRPTVAGNARIGRATLRTSGFVTIASVADAAPDRSVAMKAGEVATLRAPYVWQRHADLASMRFTICPGVAPATDSTCAAWGYGDWKADDGKRYCNYPFIGGIPQR